MEFEYQQSPVTPEAQPVTPEAQPVTPVRKPKKKLGLIIGIVAAVVVLAVAAYFIYGALTNTYKTPIKNAEKIANSDSIDIEDMVLDQLNGFAKKEYKELLSLMAKSDTYKEMFESLEESLEQQIESNKARYGDNYKVKIKIEDKEKLDKDDLEAFEDALHTKGEDQLKAMEDEGVDDYTDDQWEQTAQAIGLSVSDAKKFADATEALAKKFKSAKVTAGYELTIVKVTSGSELDEPLEEETTVQVYKIDGRWILGSTLSSGIF